MQRNSSRTATEHQQQNSSSKAAAELQTAAAVSCVCSCVSRYAASSLCRLWLRGSLLLQLQQLPFWLQQQRKRQQPLSCCSHHLQQPKHTKHSRALKKATVDAAADFAAAVLRLALLPMLLHQQQLLLPLLQLLQLKPHAADSCLQLCPQVSGPLQH